MADQPVSELFSVLIRWATSLGAEKISELPGVWQGETADWSVKINGHPREIDDVPPYGYLCQHKTAFIGIALGDINGGCVMGPSEAELIAHFKAATNP